MRQALEALVAVLFAVVAITLLYAFTAAPMQCNYSECRKVTLCP